MTTIQAIRAKIERRQYEFSKHAVDQSITRDVGIREMEDAITGKSEMIETMMDAKVTYTLEKGGKFFIVENVPARVCIETGEPYFAPETVENIQRIIKAGRMPDRVIETPVYQYA